MDFEIWDYIKAFSSNVELLLRRYQIFQNLSQESGFIQYLSYFDIIMVQLRALCIENERYSENYTIQVLMKKLNRSDLAQKLENYLDNEISEGVTIREAIKFIADKFICHYDSTTINDRVKETYYRACLTNPAGKYNLNAILGEILEIISLAFKEILPVDLSAKS